MVTLFALWQHCRIYYCRLKLTAVFVKRLKKGNFFVKRFLLKVIARQSGALVPSIFGNEPTITTRHMSRFIPPGYVKRTPTFHAQARPAFSVKDALLFQCLSELCIGVIQTVALINPACTHYQSIYWRGSTINIAICILVSARKIVCRAF
ncbi:hypothetical protein PsgB076_13004 [Pseudomonas savastanoi pv. glycinea str. B076]|nr:hypothetical protein PsgB076_13004 [Pseudomonas savastanoi pv. glycinea str. B076]